MYTDCAIQMNAQYSHRRRHLSDVLTTTALRHSDEEAVVFEDQRLTWRELDLQVTALAKALLALGIVRGDRIGVLCPPRPEYLYTYLAAARIGAITTGFSVQYTAREIVEYAQLVRPVAMIVVPELGAEAEVGALCDAMPFVKHRIGINVEGVEGVLSFAELLASGAKLPNGSLHERMAQLDEEDGALIVFTGGVTGAPKPALLSHKNIYVSIAIQNRIVDFRPTDRVILHLPMNHVSGAVLVAGAAIMAGTTLVLLDRFHPAKVLDLVEREQITILGQVPTMFIMELTLPDFAEFDLSSVRLSIIAGAATPPDAMRQVATMAPVTTHAYGLTEATGMVSYTHPDDDVETLVKSVGQMPAGIEVRIVDDHRRPLPAGVVGEIALRGEVVMVGYFGNPEATAHQIDADGWLYTGDYGMLDERNYLHMKGCKKEMYISGGYNVYPLEVERYVNAHPDVVTSACVAYPDPVMGEVGALFVLLKPNATVTRSDLRAYCKVGLARYKQPRHIRILDALPTTTTGDIDKKALASLRAPNGSSQRVAV